MSLSAAERAEYDALLSRQAANLEWLAAAQRTYPLAGSCLWEAPTAPEYTSQRRAVIGVMRAPIVGVVMGGWRSGKSLGLKQLTVAMAMGSSHPACQQWLELNRLPLDVIPEGPGKTYAIAQTFSDSKRYHRDDFEDLVGKGVGRWHSRHANDEALLEIPVPGWDRPGRIWFKAIKQGRRSYQGIPLRWAWIDEEPYTDDGYEVYDELRGRVAEEEGRIGMSMAPLEGITWVHDRLLVEKQDDARIFNLDTLDNPHLPRSSFERLYKGMSEDEVAQRRFGHFRSKSGLVYPLWAEGDGGDDDRWGPGHLCEPFDIPDDWVRFRAADFGLVAPTCVLWGALGDDDTLYVYREYYQADGESWGWHAANVAELEGWEPDGDRKRWTRGPRTEHIESGFGDPSGKEAREAFADCNVGMAPADNDVKGGIDRVKDRLRLRQDQRPRLKVFRGRCPNLVREMRGYVWDPNRRDEVPLKKDDHAPDTLRYLVQGIYGWRQIVGSLISPRGPAPGADRRAVERSTWRSRR